MKDWGEYKNGNYTVRISLKDGTKIRYNNEDSLIPSTIENFDYKITSMCDMGCPFCFESSTIDGKHADIMHQKFINTLHPYTEIAIGGGNPLCHPDLVPFLEKCKSLKLIPSITVNQNHFERAQKLIRRLVDDNLVYGIGVSLTDPTSAFIDLVKQYDNAVIHVINGVLTEEQLNALMYNDLKILILGYKEVGKGETLYKNAKKTIEERKTMLKNSIGVSIKNGSFKAISFDNRALQQLDIKNEIPKKMWDLFFMGDDGINGDYTSASMFVDGVRGTFSLNSCCQERFPLKDNIIDMYKFLVDKYGKKEVNR